MDNDGMWSVLLAITILVLLLHSIYQMIATAPEQPLTPLPPSMALCKAKCLMGNGDILLCYPRRGGGSFLMRTWSELISAVTRSFSEHISVLVCDPVSGHLMVLENSNPMTRLMSIEEYIQVSHDKGLYVMWRPLRDGGIPRATTDRILPLVLGRWFPTPFQMFLQHIMSMMGMPPVVGNPTCIRLTLYVLQEGGVIPAHVNTLGWTTDRLSSRCWPADDVIGPEFELTLATSVAERHGR